MLVIMMVLGAYGPRSRWAMLVILSTGLLLAIPLSAFFWSYILPTPMTPAEYDAMQGRAVAGALGGYVAGIAIRHFRSKRQRGIDARRRD